VSYRPWLADRALRQMGGLPAEALDLLAQTMARICADPYDRLFSVPVSDDPRERMAESRIPVRPPPAAAGCALRGPSFSTSTRTSTAVSCSRTAALAC
jgi:hypothetical protein